MFYADVQNVYNHKADQPALLIRESDSNKLPVTDPVQSVEIQSEIS